MKKIYTIAAIAHKGNKNIVTKTTKPTTIKEARNNIHTASQILKNSGYEASAIVILKNGKIAFPALNQDLKNITNTATGKTLWEEVQS
jgi:hypothetical protein